MLTYSQFYKVLSQACRSSLEGYPLEKRYEEYLASKDSLEAIVARVVLDFDCGD